MVTMMWGYGGGWGWGAWLAMGFGMVVFWGVIIAGALVLVRYLAGGRHGGSSGRVDVSGAEQVLAERFARGEIDEDEYRRRSALLRGGR
ncbi:SHOCT domain-containing protein [Pseudonocardia halophobica]|uniref:SHOCT domain-containing protein n=1 Tax=Pseudonocardia halophobica TaxID=29401 RepID=UPI003CD0664B